MPHEGLALRASAACKATSAETSSNLATPIRRCWPGLLTWVDAIAQLYRLNAVRLAQPQGSAHFDEHDRALRQALLDMAERRSKALSQATLCEPAAKVLVSMGKHWTGLTLFADHPAVPMDNNIAERAHRTAVIGRKNFLRLRQSVVGPTGRCDVYRADDGQAVQAQPPNLAAGLPAGLLRGR